MLYLCNIGFGYVLTRVTRSGRSFLTKTGRFSRELNVLKDIGDLKWTDLPIGYASTGKAVERLFQAAYQIAGAGSGNNKPITTDDRVQFRCFDANSNDAVEMWTDIDQTVLIKKRSGGFEVYTTSNDFTLYLVLRHAA